MFFSGGSDGAMHALKIATGEPVWHWDVSKRGLNTAALMVGTDVIVTHSEENIAIERDGHARRGAGGVEGHADRQGRALDRARRPGRLRLAGVATASASTSSTTAASCSRSTSKTGKQLWTEKLGTIQKSSPVLADGKLYVGTENGKFYIIRPHADKAEILDSDQLGHARSNPEAIIASPAVARGRVYVVTMAAMYAIGPKSTPASARRRGRSGAGAPPARPALRGPAATLLVTPTDLILKPGESVALTITAFDAKRQAGGGARRRPRGRSKD